MQEIRQKAGVGTETYVDDERAGYYEAGETYQVDDAKAQALLKTGRYELVDANPTSTWDGQVPEEPAADPAPAPAAPDVPAAPSTEPTTEAVIQAITNRNKAKAIPLPAAEPAHTEPTPDAPPAETPADPQN